MVASRRCLKVMRYCKFFVSDLGDSRMISLGTVQLKARCVTFLGTWISSTAGMKTCEAGCKVLWGREMNTVTVVELVLK
jgi:putative Ca2+/H+ antiporter (TMEM165/GDT1 family)